MERVRTDYQWDWQKGHVDKYVDNLLKGTGKQAVSRV